MPQIVFTDQPRLDKQQLVEILRAADEQYDPVEELLDLQRELLVVEQKQGITSAEFYQRYHAGEMGDAVEIVRWAALYRQYVQLKSMISDSLNVVVSINSVPLPV